MRFLATALIALVPFTTVAAETSASFSFTMDWIYVSGRRNDVTHQLGAGVLTISGTVSTGGNDKRPLISEPAEITISVKEKTLLGGKLICSVTVQPRIAESVSFTKACGPVSRSVYFIEGDKAVGDYTDGFRTTATGTLTTKT